MTWSFSCWEANSTLSFNLDVPLTWSPCYTPRLELVILVRKLLVAHCHDQTSKRKRKIIAKNISHQKLYFNASWTSAQIYMQDIFLTTMSWITKLDPASKTQTSSGSCNIEKLKQKSSHALKGGTVGSVPIVSVPWEGGGRLFGSKFTGYVLLASQNPNHYTCSSFFYHL